MIDGYFDYEYDELDAQIDEQIECMQRGFIYEGEEE